MLRIVRFGLEKNGELWLTHLLWLELLLFF